MILREKKVSVYSEVPIVDNEISNDISVPKGQGDWLYEKSDIISCAILYKDTLTIILREKNDDVITFKKQLKELLDKLPTMYAFNYRMEKYGFKGFLGKSYFVEEIKPFKGKGFNKQKFFEILLENKIISEKIEDPLEKDSAEVLKKYAEEDYEAIITHNIADVLKQFYIWKNQEKILKIFAGQIDEGGWYVGSS